MKRLVLTGATGFVGANIAHYGVRHGYDVHIFVRKGYKKWRIKDIIKNLHVHIVDLQDERQLTRVLKTIKPHWIFHTAVHGAYSSQTNLQEMVQTNIVGTMSLVRAACAVGFETFINTGSSSEYGYKDHAPKENELLEPNSHYAVTKACATQFCTFTAQDKKMPIYTLRLYSAFGPYEEPTRLMPTLISHARTGTLPALADPSIARDYIYIDDIVRAYFAVAKKKNQIMGAVYNIGTQRQTTLRELVHTVSTLLPLRQKPQWGSMPKRSWDTSVWVSDCTLIHDAVGWKPSFTLEAGLKKMILWQKRQK